ncbi:hypothetical protein DFQ28_003141 [Apophysomyces sp. BC1034]|nr:hypothetical protein DFQ30_002031 [Apophysomyces sp. BC1015]KAG0179230.1 hypothetical protein DFQ29_002354 [Apophysomyces sp. BC1021]KAG0189632.1 hypothetical protein DFQ28_003141 [Apophysomyces sp. BC1034]
MLKTIKVEDMIPDVALKYVPYSKDEDLKACPIPIPYNLHEQLRGKKAVIFAIPGAFTPTCSEKHVPEYLAKYEELKAKGVDVVICTAINDGFVMNAFAKVSGTTDKILMASEGGSGFYEKLGLTQDLTRAGLGIRSQRFALLVDDLVVKYVGVEDGPGVSVSGVDAILSKL